MHTFESNGILFHYNSDLSGGVLMGGAEISESIGVPLAAVPAQAILDFVAEHVRRCKIAEVERWSDSPEERGPLCAHLRKMTTAELLGI
jgi:hypothetical protein